MKLSPVVGTTSKPSRIFVRDSSKTTGIGLTGLAYNTAGLVWNYIRENQSANQSVTLVTATVGTWTSGGFKEIDSVNLPGMYEIGIPNAALASGKSVQMMLMGAANMAPVLLEYELTAVDNQDAQRAGLTALPATGTLAVKPAVTLASTDVTGNLPGDVQTIKTQAVNAGGSITFPAAATLASTTNITGASGVSLTQTFPANFSSLAISATGIVDGNTKQILGTTLTETVGGNLAAAYKKWFDVSSPTGTVNSLPNAVPGGTGGVFIAGTNAPTIVTTSFTTTFTGNLTGSVASVAGAVASVTGSVGSVVGAVGSIAAGGIVSASFGTGATIPRVTLADTLTAYTGNTPQTGDAFARLGSPVGASVSVDIASVNTAVSAINSNSALVRLIVPGQLPIPASSTTAYEFDVWLYDVEGHNINADGASNGIGSITFHVKNASGTSLDSQLGSVSWISTGGYKITYTVNSTDTPQELVVTASAVVGGVTRTLSVATLTAPYFATTFTSTDRTALNALTTTLGLAGAGLTGLPAVTVGTNNDKAGYALATSPPTAAAIATAVWQDTTAGDFTVASSIGKSLYTTGNAPGAASGLALVGSNMGTVTTAANLTNLPSIPANWLTGTGVDATAVTKIQAGLATPTNITAGTIATVTNLTNAPTAGDLTATMKASITTAATAATPTVATVGTVTNPVTVDLTQVVPLVNAVNTTGDCLNAARANAFGKTVINTAVIPATETIYAPDGITVIYTQMLSCPIAPTQRI